VRGGNARSIPANLFRWTVHIMTGLRDEGGRQCLWSWWMMPAVEPLLDFSRVKPQGRQWETFRTYVECYGLPQALYVDRDSIYRCEREPTVEEQLKQIGPLTQFGRAMKELGVKIIPAYSPQAKGRVERTNATLQDRLVKEMRLAGIKNN